MNNDSSSSFPAASVGTVYLVGAGPGDPKLITVRGAECIARADAVVYDRLANPRLLRHMRSGAERIYAGKLPDRHTMSQEQINQLLVDLALQGKTVVRLKGGDPSVFGRVGEEAELLAIHKIPFEIVPGITSAIAVPAYAGIPVTHREYASSIAIITGHERADKEQSAHHWSKLASAADTTIFLMGVGNLTHIRDQLIAHGRCGDTPIALVRWGTRAEQATLTGTLSSIVEQVKETGFQPPAVIIVGEVVKLRSTLSWYENKPLFGQRVLVTRATDQASQLADGIDELGGEAIEFPVIRTRKPQSQQKQQQLKEAYARLAEFDWALFTSPNGVGFFFEGLRQYSVDIRSMSQARIAAIGPKTASLLREHGLVCEDLPTEFLEEGLLNAVHSQIVPGQKVLLPRGNLAGDGLPARLRSLGLDVTEAEVYETVAEEEVPGEAVELLRNGAIQMITFTSSSTVEFLLAALRNCGVENPHELLNRTAIVCIGPVTAATARQKGLHPCAVAEEATIGSLLQALVAAKPSTD